VDDVKSDGFSIQKYLTSKAMAGIMGCGEPFPTRRFQLSDILITLW